MSQKWLDLHGGWQVQLGLVSGGDVDVLVLGAGVIHGELGDLLGDV